MRIHPTRRLFRLTPALVTAAALAAPAAASAECYKGICDRLDIDAIGANYGSIEWADRVITVDGVSGGDVDVRYLGSTSDGPCVGYATVLPDHVLYLDRPEDLELVVRSNGDTTLVVQGPDGWRCNDDAIGSDPAIEGRFSAGLWRVWVGSYSPGHADYRFDILPQGASTPPSPPPVPTPPPTAALDPAATTCDHDALTLGAHDLAAGIVTEGRPGGSVDMSYLGSTLDGPCVGYADARPDHILTLTDRVDDLALVATGSVDTTLVVHGPHGWRCNDDAEGLDPAIAGSFPPGTYRVWVGTWDPADRGRYALEVFDRAGAPLPARAWTFEGRFEDTDVRFVGGSIDELHRACTGWASSSSSSSMVDDITIFGRSWRNGPTWWDASELCAIVALNARPEHPTETTLSGTVEDVPFEVSGSPDEVRDAIRRYLPTAIDDASVDDLTVDGRQYRNGPSWWDSAEVVQMVLSHVVAGDAAWFAEGTFEQTPFRFAGATVDEIRVQCETFYGSVMDGELVDDMVVNGTSRRNGPSWWNATDACMIVSSLAQRR